jgi:hypothetical protein
MTMNAVLVENVSWSSRRWWRNILLVFIGQVILIAWLSERPGSQAKPRSASINVHYIADPGAAEHFIETTAMSDPTLFAHINPHGFSGSAWLKAPTLPFSMTNRIAAPRWLKLTAENLTADFGRLIQTNFNRSFPSAEKLPPGLSHAWPPSPRRVIQPVLRFEGELTQRRLISTNSLPPTEPDLTLSTCIIEVIVNSAGHTLSLTKLSSSGSDIVDKSAVHFARSARFAPFGSDRPRDSSDQTNFTVGKLIFQWIAVEASVTNGSAAKP